MAASAIFGSLGGYSAEFLTPEQQERFKFVKTKVCGNKTVDIADLEKNGMYNVVEALIRMQWMGVTTFSEVSYPDLVKAFYVCLNTQEDGSLVSYVKGTQIKIDSELLHELFGVTTSRHSGVHSVNAQVKGLGIVGPGYRLRDGKLDINQLNAFNRLLHFIVCQNLVPRSATFSTCSKADSDMMFWAIQNKEINMAAVMMERMTFARDQIWDTKSKLNVSLPYAHLLTKVFKHFGIDLAGAVVEKTGQSIRSRNLRKSGFSVIDGVWSKTIVAKGEAIIEGPVEEAVEGAADNLPTSIIASILRDVVDSVLTTPVTSETGGIAEEVVASGHIEESVEATVQEEQSSAPTSVVLEDAPIQGEQELMEKMLLLRGSNPRKVKQKKQLTMMSQWVMYQLMKTYLMIRMMLEKGRQPAPQIQMMISLLQFQRLDAQGTILCCLQSDVNSIFMSQASATKEISNTRNAMKWFNQEMGTMKNLLGDILKVVGAQIPPPPPPAAQVPESGPSRPSVQEAGPTGPEAVAAPAKAAVNVQRPSRPAEQVEGSLGQAEQVSGPTGPLESEPVQTEAEEESLAPKPPAPSSPSHTPIPPTPPSAPTAPPAPQTFKKPQSRPISSPTPFPPHSTSSPASSTTIPSPSPILEAPPASSAGASSSSSGPSLGPIDDLPTTSHSFLHPTPPPSFITIIPERAQLNSPFMEKIKDEFEEGIIRLTSSEWSKFYPLSAQQLFALNEAQAREVLKIREGSEHQILGTEPLGYEEPIYELGPGPHTGDPTLHAQSRAEKRSGKTSRAWFSKSVKVLSLKFGGQSPRDMRNQYMNLDRAQIRGTEPLGYEELVHELESGPDEGLPVDRNLWPEPRNFRLSVPVIGPGLLSTGALRTEYPALAMQPLSTADQGLSTDLD
ncbi:hypothetical protein Taro_051196 [Colocasia esculenta]|uniref:Putative plant transposon protein domain-containing protein n=1 Tax=Colocasia esculenta TaxID=4460 RepID=A0A843XFC1_COLES|nr:hypothetical protein [Colocasia esculenta]